MKNEVLTATKIKGRFVDTIYRMIMYMLKINKNEVYQDCFKVEGSSIMCSLPSNFFHDNEIPEGTRIEIKFIMKKD